MLVIVLSAVIGLCAGGPQQEQVTLDCAEFPPGIVWWGCGSYGFCNNQGIYDQIDCVNGTVFDRNSGDCQDPSQQIAFPCSLNLDPSICFAYNGSTGHRIPLDDGMGTDTFTQRPMCAYYYTCFYGQVYFEEDQRCVAQGENGNPCDVGTRTQGGNQGGGNRGNRGGQFGGNQDGLFVSRFNAQDNGNGGDGSWRRF